MNMMEVRVLKTIILTVMIVEDIETASYGTNDNT